MKIGINQLRKLISEAINEAYRGNNIGSITADIAGDSRYTDTLNVDYKPDTDTVLVRVSVGSPLGGMDSFTPSDFREDFRKEIPADDLKGIMSALKYALSDNSYNFKRYGKPTKNFFWNHDGVGPSMANLKAALDLVRRV